jgi:hypothetical protein
MQNKLFESQIYEKIMMDHIWNMISAMLDNTIEFRILCHKENVSFEPELPNRVTDTMGDMTLFEISNYSFESAVLIDKELHFGAGFGSENIGTTVIVPILSIAQIFLGEIPIILNFTTQNKEDEKEVVVEKNIDNSMNALLNNPNNQHLLKKRKR